MPDKFGDEACGFWKCGGCRINRNLVWTCLDLIFYWFYVISVDSNLNVWWWFLNFFQKLLSDIYQSCCSGPIRQWGQLLVGGGERSIRFQVLHPHETFNLRDWWLRLMRNAWAVIISLRLVGVTVRGWNTSQLYCNKPIFLVSGHEATSIKGMLPRSVISYTTSVIRIPINQTGFCHVMSWVLSLRLTWGNSTIPGL